MNCLNCNKEVKEDIPIRTIEIYSRRLGQSNMKELKMAICDDCVCKVTVIDMGKQAHININYMDHPEKF